MLGTAFPAARLLLVEQPGPWGRAGLLDSRFSRSVAHRLIARLDPAGVRVLAIRRPGRSVAGGRRRWALVDCRPGRERLRWGTYADDVDLLAVDTDAAVQPPELREEEKAGGVPVFLVCAHGTHDACCAIRGRPVAAALALARPDEVWESSHVGGDRFAANVLVLPTGMLYGRVPQQAASTLVAATDHGLVLEEYLRGRVGFAPHDQVAMAHVHRERPGLAVHDVLALGSSSPEPGLTAVRVRAGAATVEVTVRVERAQREWLTCQALQPSSAVVHRPVSLREASAADAR